MSDSRRRAGARAFAAAALLWHALLPAASADEGDPTNVYMAGADVRVDAPVEGDLFAIAGRLNVEQPVEGDAVLAAGSIELASRIGDDLRAAGGVVSVGGRIVGEALIVAASIAFGRDTEIFGPAWLAGGDIAVAGHLFGGLKAYGKNILILGEVYGPVELSGERIEVLGSARIVGDLTYSSRKEIMIDPRAQISGSVTWAPGAFEFPRPKLRIPGLPALRPLFLLGLLAAGTLLLALFPRFTAHALQTMGASPVKSIGLGTAIFFSLPPVILLLVITIIGIPIALILAAFYAVALLVGYLVTALFVGERLARAARRHAEPTFAWRIGALAVALLLLWLAYTLPYVGGFIVFVALLAGLGAMVLQAFSSYAARA